MDDKKVPTPESMQDRLENKIPENAPKDKPVPKQGKDVFGLPGDVVEGKGLAQI